MGEQPQRGPVEAARETPIVVTAEREEDRISEQTGSRIPGKPLFTNENIRSATGIAPLTPGSGMSPLGGQSRIHKKRIATCVADNDAIGEQASCILARAQEDIAAGEVGLGADSYRYLASSDRFSAEERLAGGNKLYELGEARSDDGLREEALIRLLETDAMPANEARSARRTLVAMALTRKDTTLAIERLEDIVANDRGDARSLANLAILLRQEGREGALQRMAEAIAATEATGGTAPKGWTDFVKQEG
ncbi:hypothetical protein ELI_07130 [Erythrobacter litoralis HTCC2594]|uniref:Tetratricopeptide repeat protein n=1 Tax=Erythrobacter litoralis (strain HTCC2594) TaxID=314225 RepID=Q2N9X3_ERYLH|nr:hypothetical protein ELI_07130 [Erythrobacter litoralis HTCC2594]